MLDEAPLVGLGDGMSRIIGAQPVENAPNFPSNCSYTDEYLDAALEVGATGYILKSSTREAVVRSLRAASQGQVLIDP